MREVLEALIKLLAPVLAFTSEEAWGYLGRGGSIHLQEFPQPAESRRNLSAEMTMQELLKLRGVIGQAVEQARQEKLIGNALEARVVLRCDTAAIADVPKDELEEFFILSDLQLEQSETASATITKTPYGKCARCWRHRESVGASEVYPDLCERCEGVVSARAEATK